MARKSALTTESLAALGAERLAGLLMELGEADPAVRKRLVLVAAEGGGRDAVVKAIDRRLKALAGSRGFVPWEKARAYAIELDGLRRAIGGSLTALDAGGAAERLARLIRLAPSVFERVDDPGGRFGEVFRAAVDDLGKAWSRIESRDPETVAADAFALVASDDYGVCDGLIEAAAPALGEVGFDALAERARAVLAKSDGPKGGKFDWSQRSLQRLLADIADAKGDVDAFIGAQTALGEDRIDVLGIAGRLLDAGRAEEALAWLDREGKPRVPFMTYAELAVAGAGGEPRFRPDLEREGLRVRALEGLGRLPEAQQVRWRLFEEALDVQTLRDYVRALPDFEEFDALDRAFALAAAHRNAPLALSFFVEWPRLDLAARLVVSRGDELDGRYYDILGPAAEALSQAHPSAATMLYRRMIDSVLERAASQAYSHAAHDLAACAELSGRLDPGDASLASHADYLDTLRARHGRKRGFWSLVQD